MEPRNVDALLIGGGVAAARCARALRRGGFAGSIVLVGEEATPPYNRPPLSKELLREELPLDLVLAEPLSWYERRGVELWLGVPAISLDSGERLLELADGRRLRYGDCLLATGAAPRRPSFGGASGALLLRTIDDAHALRARAVAGSRAAVVGGGFIGVEVAASLAARGVAVAIHELGSALWGGSLGRAVSEWAVRRLASAGVDAHFGAAVTSVDELAADLVVAGVGVQPRTALAEGAGLLVDDGIVVDDGQAAAPHLFAAGDVARVRGLPRVEHWHAARESGERAAAAMLGLPAPPLRAPWIFSEFAGAQLDVVGAASAGDEEVELAPGVIGFVRDEVVVQVAILDGAAAVEPVRALVERGGSAADLRHLLRQGANRA